jgi:hypothetical protein
MTYYELLFENKVRRRLTVLPENKNPKPICIGRKIPVSKINVPVRKKTNEISFKFSEYISK